MVLRVRCIAWFHVEALSAHHQIDAREDGFHLSFWDFSNAIGQLSFVDGHELRDVCNGVPIESGLLGTQKHVSRGNRPAQITCQNDAYNRCELASIQWVRLYDHDGATVARG